MAAQHPLHDIGPVHRNEDPWGRRRVRHGSVAATSASQTARHAASSVWAQADSSNVFSGVT